MPIVKCQELTTLLWLIFQGRCWRISFHKRTLVLLLKVTINSTSTMCLLNVFFITICITWILLLLKYFCETEMPVSWSLPNEHYLSLFPELVRGMLTMLVYCRSFSVVFPAVTIPQQAQGDCTVNMDQQQLVGISQYSTYFGDEFGTASFFFLVYTCMYT